MRSSARTDLASEAVGSLGGAAGSLQGLHVRHEAVRGAEVFCVEISDDDAAAAVGKAKGKYFTVELNRHITRASEEFRSCAEAVAELIRACGVPKGLVLVAALGNPDITPDALGPLCAGSVLVTRHLKQGGGELWRDFAPVSLVRTGVLGTAGIESAAHIRALCGALRPSLVVAVDALAGADPAALCRSIQICDSGISPGSGVCNDRERIDRESLGVPVTAIGVPTVADAAALSGSEETRGLFVTPRDIDSSVRECARMIGYGIDLALHPSLSIEDIDALVG